MYDLEYRSVISFYMEINLIMCKWYVKFFVCWLKLFKIVLIVLKIVKCESKNMYILVIYSWFMLYMEIKMKVDKYEVFFNFLC